MWDKGEEWGVKVVRSGWVNGGVGEGGEEGVEVRKINCQ